MPRRAADLSPRGRLSRAQAKESSSKNVAFGVLHGPIGLDAVSSKLAIVVGLSIAIVWCVRLLAGERFRFLRGAFGRVFMIVGAFFGVFLAGYTGVLLSVSNQPIWSDTWALGGLFLASGLSVAAAALALLARTWASAPTTAIASSLTSRTSPTCVAAGPRQLPPHANALSNVAVGE